VWSLLLACASPDPEAARAARLRDWLRDDAAPWRGRDPSLLVDKLDVMAADPYDFMRGTTGWYWAELARPDPDRAPTAFLADPRAWSVLLVGDPHLENLATCLPGPEPDPGTDPVDTPLLLEPVDLDAATFGPWTLDPRRAAAALALVGARLDGCDAACVDEVSTALGEAYAATILAPPDTPLAWDTSGRVLAELAARAHAEGTVLAELADATEVDGDSRRLRRDDEALELSDEEAAQLARLLADWSARPAGFRPLDAVRRLGSGVSSRPATRYGVLWDLGDPDWADDRLLNVREVVEPPVLPGAPASPGWPTLADRVDALPGLLWSRRDADVLYGAAEDGAQTFKLTAWSGWTQAPDHGDLAAEWLTGGIDAADLQATAATVGTLLARAHSRAPLAGAEDVGGAEVIAGELDGRVDTWVAELVRDARADAERIEADHALFLGLRERHGPLLGMDAEGAW